MWYSPPGSRGESRGASVSRLPRGCIKSPSPYHATALLWGVADTMGRLLMAPPLPLCCSTCPPPLMKDPEGWVQRGGSSPVLENTCYDWCRLFCFCASRSGGSLEKCDSEGIGRTGVGPIKYIYLCYVQLAPPAALVCGAFVHKSIMVVCSWVLRWGWVPGPGGWEPHHRGGKVREQPHASQTHSSFLHHLRHSSYKLVTSLLVFLTEENILTISLRNKIQIFFDDQETDGMRSYLTGVCFESVLLCWSVCECISPSEVLQSPQCWWEEEQTREERSGSLWFLSITMITSFVTMQSPR